MKKILSFLIAISFVFSVSITSFAQDTDLKNIYNEYSYGEALTLFNSATGGAVFEKAPYEIVTRAEFVKAAVKVFNVQKISGESVYSDVKDDHPCLNEIITAYGLGWISKADSFYPDAAITYPQAIKIILEAADYGVLAGIKGGFPTGYMNIAEMIDLTDNITVNGEGTVTAADANILLYNIMLSNVFEAVSAGDDPEYKTKDKTYIEKSYNVYSVKGELTDTEHSSTTNTSAFDKENGKIKIDGVMYRYDDSDISMLGKNVVAYCDEDALPDRKVMFMFPTKSNTELLLSAENYGGIADNRLQYFDETKSHKANLVPSYKVIYNGRRVPAITPQMLEDSGATIRLLSNNNDDRYEYIFIDAYAYGTITSVDYVSGYIAFKTPAELIDLTIDDEHICYIRDEYGVRKEIYELLKDSVVAVKRSDDNRIFDITILSETVSGTVSAMNTTNRQMEIEGSSYKISKAFTDAYLVTNIIGVGDRITVAIGIHGEIACLVSSASEAQYGIINKAAQKNSGLDNQIQIKMVTDSGEFEVFELAEKVVVDGSNITRANAYTIISSKMAEAQSDANKPVLVVKYTTDEKGNISLLDFASSDTGNFGKVLDPQDSLTKYISYQNLAYRDAGFPSKVMLKTTAIMAVPKVEAERDEEINYTIGDSSMLSSNYGTYIVDAYDIDENGNAAYVVIYLDDTTRGKMAGYTGSYIIEKVVSAIENDETGVQLYCWSNNTFHKIFMPDDISVNKASGEQVLTSGDIVRLTVLDNEVKEVYVDYDYDSSYVPGSHKPENAHIKNTRMVAGEEKSVSGASYVNGDAQHYLSFVFGKVYSVGSNTVVISDAKTGDTYTYNYSDLRPYSINEYIACYDTDTKTVRTIKLSEIRTAKGYDQNADFIYIRSDYGVPKCAFVVR